MRSNALRGPAALACLGLLLGACATDSPDPNQPNLAAGVVISREVLESDFTFNPRGCAPENIAFHFRTAFRIQSVVANDGRRFIDNIQIVEQGSSGVGVLTGTLYRLAGGHHEVFSAGKNGTDTAIMFQRYVSQGPGGDFTCRVQVHFTLTPDQEIVSEIERIDFEC
jgi:hypothetical protein